MVIPNPVLRIITYPMEFGPMITNVPSTPKISFGEELLPISDYLVYVPDTERQSFVLSLSTYDNRLQLAIGTSLDVQQNDIQNLLKNTYKYIDQLDIEINSINLTSNKNSLQ
ncbi:hypothetical protein FQR65_LT00963 [Abscondita terminalis]|nr:hypothetical protein FQR65_LT00963 [Abscondita terminalis]